MIERQQNLLNQNAPLVGISASFPNLAFRFCMRILKYILFYNNFLPFPPLYHHTHPPTISKCYRRTGSLRPTTGPFYGKRSRGTTGAAAAGSGGGGTANANAADRHKRKPPRGMYINHDDIVALASPENEQTAGRGGGGGGGDDLLASMDREINTLLSQVSATTTTTTSTTN